MALGKNMRVERLIPLAESDEKTLDKNVNKENNFVEDQVEDEVQDAPINVSLDDFFGESNIVNVAGAVATDHSEPSEISETLEISEPLEIPKVSEISNQIKESIESQSEPQPVSQSLYEDVNEETIKIIFTPSRRKTQKRILIAIEGNLTINNVEILYSKVNDVFENYDFVEVTLKNVTAIDLTVIQLFHAIRVTYYPQQKFISINAEFSRDDRKLLNTCGFTEFQTAS